MLDTCYRLQAVTGEMEIDYHWGAFKPIDFITHIPVAPNVIKKTAVSVTRAMTPRRRIEGELVDLPYTKDLAQKLVYRKLCQLVAARKAVKIHHQFEKAILHVWCQTYEIANLILEVFFELPECKNILCMCTVTSFDKVYSNRF